MTRDRVKERAKEAHNRTEKLEPTVEKWLEDVENVLEEVQLLEGRISEVNKSYFKRQCQYFLAKEIARKTEEIIQLDRNSKFEPFSRITELPGMKYFSSNNFVLFNSTETAYKQLLEALKDKSCSMIGLVGIGGSGKTTLAKEVGKKVQELKLFEKVAMATVSQTPSITSIQDQIADQLNLYLKEASEIGRAQRLSKTLRNGTTLLILDDVWEKLNFEALGIPFDENTKGCCVLLTTRSTEVCAFMQCQSIIELHLLTDKEAWSLFTSYANITDAYSEALKGVARKIVNHCKGLPIAIVTVGSTLRGKTIEEFELALSRLEDSKPLDIPRGFTSPHVCLELSYINLTNQLSKSLLLLCSIFPEDYEIDLEDLFRFGRGLGITGKFGTLEEARREMHVAITSLRNSCLLMNSNKKERVKMHDMVRDVALWIASKTGQEILASAKMDPRVLVEDEIMKDKKAIALWGLKKDQVLGDYKINCPTLEILLVCEEVGFNVSDACLESLERLKILAILNLPWRTRYSKSTLPLPVSLKSLQNLQTLCLRGYKLGNISVLESLQALEILDLRGSIFEELPIGIVDLKKLKLLDLYYCQIEKNNAYEVVGKCLRLEELYLYFIQFVDDFPRNVSFSRLQRYSIIIQGKFSILEDFVHNRSMEQLRPSRALCIERFQRFISPLNDLFIRADYLYLKYFEGDYQNVIPSMDPKGMNQLIVLKLHSCPVIECLYDSTIIRNNINMLQTEVVFSSLVKLRLSQLDSLRELFRDPNFRCSLKNLEELLIAGCKQLNNISFPRNSKLCNLKLLIIGGCPLPTSLFMPSVVQTLLLLEVLEISSCTSLRHIIEEVEEGNADFSSTRNHSSLTFPKLRTLLIERCEKLEYIFSVFLAQGLVNLESVKVLSNSKLKYVFGSEKEHNYHYQSFQQTNTGRNLPNLDTLELMNLPNLSASLD
ncbi:unnamed protein product [Sphenostylis stenocarpa]|uniref:NB-ARC domain-containing protein n=1 Tax=Sphenostylis stenocarpa TaxID=92480 RepID=A0AA86SYA5_9FABA|nr:unnamed protein product [Sphenostylis stenocarpa]